MNEWLHRFWLMILACWMLLFIVPVQAETIDQAQTAPASAAQDNSSVSVQVDTASAVPAVPTPDEDFEAGVKAESAHDSMEALILFKRAAEAGHAKAQARYAEFLKMGQLYPEAIKYFRKSIQGDNDGQYGLAGMYESGEGIKQDFSIARFLYGLAAEQGQRDASFKLAEIYLKGQPGLDDADRQGPEALSAIRRAAGFNHLPSLDALAVAYREGKFGLTVDPDQADVIVAITNKMRGIVVKEKKKSALFKLLKGDQDKK